MSGGGAGDFLKKNWHGLPIGDALMSPKWIKAHPREAMTAAAIAATVYTGGAAAGVWGGLGAAGAGAGAAGLGAAELGPGAAAAAGSGLAAADYAAMGLGSTALAGSAPAAVYGAELASTPNISAGLLQTVGNMGPEQASMLAAQNEGFGFAGLDSTLQAANPTYSNIATGLDKAGNAFKMYNRAQIIANQFAPPKQAPVAPKRPPQYQSPEAKTIQALLDEIYKRKEQQL